FQSQGGANAWRTTLTTTEQVRLYRRITTEQVTALAKVTPDLTVVGVPGNHDEAHRPLHTYGDSWAIETMAAIKDTLALAGRSDHIMISAPPRYEVTMAPDVSGALLGLEQCHQLRRGQAVNWWAKQSHSRQPVGDADLLISALLRHLRIDHTGSDKALVQLP